MNVLVLCHPILQPQSGNVHTSLALIYRLCTWNSLIKRSSSLWLLIYCTIGIKKFKRIRGFLDVTMGALNSKFDWFKFKTSLFVTFILRTDLQNLVFMLKQFLNCWCFIYFVETCLCLCIFAVGMSVQSWLESLHLDDYLPNFLGAGYDTLVKCAQLDAEKLQNIGVSLPGHRARILMHKPEDVYEDDEIYENTTRGFRNPSTSSSGNK